MHLTAPYVYRYVIDKIFGEIGGVYYHHRFIIIIVAMYSVYYSLHLLVGPYIIDTDCLNYEQIIKEAYVILPFIYIRPTFWNEITAQFKHSMSLKGPKSENP